MPKTTAQAPDEVTATIARLVRRPSSVDGNPAWTVVLIGGARLRTRANAAVAYEIENSDLQGVPVIFTLSAHGSVTGVRLA